MWRECRTAKAKNGRITIGDRVRVWGVDDCGQDTYLTGTVSRIKRYSDKRIGTLIHVEIVDEDGIYLWEAQAHEFEKVC